MTLQKKVIGIDVSKDVLDYYISREEQGQVKNKKGAIKDFLKKFCSDLYLLVVEYTGTYSDKILELASQNNYEIRIVDPKKSHYYSRVLGQFNKTDKLAAKMLSQMAKQIDLPIYQSVGEISRARKQLQMALNALQKQFGMLRSQLHSLEQYLFVNQAAKQSLENISDSVEKEMKKIEEQLTKLEDDEAREFARLATSVTGVGPKTARLLLIQAGGFKNFETSEQFIKFLGIAPASHSSGSSVRYKAKITKNGSPQLRAVIYCAARCAKKHNHACKALFVRLRKKGKPYKVALVAVMRKLMRQTFSVVKSKNLFDNNRFLQNNSN